LGNREKDLGKQWGKVSFKIVQVVSHQLPSLPSTPDQTQSGPGLVGFRQLFYKIYVDDGNCEDNLEM
jgi:hypothetical protein